MSVSSSKSAATEISLASSVISEGHGVPFVNEAKAASREELDDDWENDPINPRNWSSSKKWMTTAIVSLYSFISPLASSVMAPGLPEIAIRYQITNPTVVALTLSIFVLSFAIGPLILAPISEMYGRTWVLHISNLFTVAFSLGCAFAPTPGVLIGLRFLSGLSASAPIGLGSASISDMYSERDRASAMALYSLGFVSGPIVGPVIGGSITQTIGVKWLFIVMAILCAVSSVIAIPLLRETYAPVIRQRRAAKSGDSEKALFTAPIDEHGKLNYLWLNLSRPIMLLFCSFICFILSLYMAFMYGIYYLMFTTFDDFFAMTYHFGPGVTGLMYIGLGIGCLLAGVFGAKFADQIYKHLANKNGGVGKPEMRIPALLFGSIFVPIGLFWYGWSAAAKTHWIMPVIGSGIFGFGLATTFIPISLYLVDSFTYAASASAASSLFRSLFGFTFPLFGQQMYSKLGMGGGSSLLAGLAIILGIPFPIWLYYKGEGMRARNPLTQASTIPKKI